MPAVPVVVALQDSVVIEEVDWPVVLDCWLDWLLDCCELVGVVDVEAALVPVLELIDEVEVVPVELFELDEELLVPEDVAR